MQLKKEALDLLLKESPVEESTSILEVFPGDGRLAETVLSSRNTISYKGFDYHPNEAGATRLLPFLNRFELFTAPLGGQIPLPAASQDLILSSFCLEKLPASHLYMIFSETRRVLKAGGHWSILSFSPGKTAAELALSYLWRRMAGVAMIEITHFISPEDWVMEKDMRQTRSGLIAQFLLLKRLP